MAIGKLRTHSTPGVSNLAKEIVKLWKDVIDENKRKRKRDDGDEVKKEDVPKRVKAEGVLVFDDCVVGKRSPPLCLRTDVNGSLRHE